MTSIARQINRKLSARQMRSIIPIDTTDPKEIAPFLLSLGYSRENVVNTLVKRCNLSPNEAHAVLDAARQADQEV